MRNLIITLNFGTTLYYMENKRTVRGCGGGLLQFFWRAAAPPLVGLFQIIHGSSLANRRGCFPVYPVSAFISVPALDSFWLFWAYWYDEDSVCEASVSRAEVVCD